MSPPPDDAGTPPVAAVTRPRYRVTRRGKVVFTALPLLIVGVVVLALSDGTEPVVAGVEHGAVLNGEDASNVSLSVEAGFAPEPEAAEIVVDGEPVPVAVEESKVTATFGPLGTGDHRVEIRIRRAGLRGDIVERLDFSVDADPPLVDLIGPTDPVRADAPVVLSFRVDDVAATVEAAGEPVTLDEGVGEVSFDTVPRTPVVVTATDPAGNVTEVGLQIPVALPGEPGQPPIRGVHASGWTWAAAELREPILEMIDEGLINTVELDLKDEAGDIWYDTSVEPAHEIGAVTELWDLESVVDDLHSRGVRVVGRLVNFRDPRLATHAVETGRLDLIVQNPDGTPYGKYGGFTNPFSADVWEYNIALAEEAAQAGVDDILYDYVRRPDDDIANLLFPGQDRPPEDAIVEFMAASQERVHAAGSRLGASVFGVAATRPDEVAQDIPRMAEHADFIAPMVYPSHWGPGEYGVSNPESQPYDIVERSLLDFVDLTAGTDAHVVAWLQDFSLRVSYGPAEVAAQIEAAEAAGVFDFLLWDAATTYTADALRG